MKQLIASLVAVSTIFFSHANGPAIRGHIRNFDPGQDNLFITIELNGPVKTIKEQRRIKDNGTFNFDAGQMDWGGMTDAMEVQLTYNDRRVTFLTDRNEMVELSFTAGCFKTDDYLSCLSIKGKYAAANLGYRKIKPWLDTLLAGNTNAFFADNSWSNSDYKKLRLQQWSDNRQSLRQLVKEKNVSDILLQNWLRVNIDYEAAKDLLYFPFIGKKDSSFTDSDPYFDFLEKIPLNDSDAIPFREYYDFLNQVVSAYEIMSNLYRDFESRRQQLVLADGSRCLIPLHLERLMTLPGGYGRQVMLARYINTVLEHASPAYRTIARQSLDSLQQYIPASWLGDVNTGRKETKTVWQYIEAFDAPHELKEELRSVFTASRGKVAYIDFWFTNCAPCMMELSHYNELIDRLPPGKMDFIFFGAYMDDKEWKDTIKKFRLKGRHFLLNRNQLSFFEKYFELAGYPHHVILLPDGTVQLNNVPRMAYDGNIEPVLTKLSKLVNE